MDQVQDSIASVNRVIKGVNQSVDRINGILSEVDETMDTVRVIVDNIEKGSEDIPQITQSAKGGIQDVRDGLDNIDRVVQSLQQNILIRSNLPPEPEGDAVDAGLRR